MVSTGFYWIHWFPLDTSVYIGFPMDSTVSYGSRGNPWVHRFPYVSHGRPWIPVVSLGLHRIPRFQ